MLSRIAELLLCPAEMTPALRNVARRLLGGGRQAHRDHKVLVGSTERWNTPCAWERSDV